MAVSDATGVFSETSDTDNDLLLSDESLLSSRRPGPTELPLRIAVLAPPFLPVPPAGYGGTERVVALLVDGLVARGHDVTLFGAIGSSTRAHLVTLLSQAPTLGDPSSIASELSYVTSAYRRAGTFDVVHDHTWLGPALGALLPGHPAVVHTIHGSWTVPNRQLLGVVHDRVNLVAISRSQKAGNPQLQYAGVVYNGIDLALHPFNPTKEDFLVFVGRISPEKRPEWAIEIARRAGLPLVMMVKRSEPIERAYWDEVVRPLLRDDVTVLDQPDHSTKVGLVGRARAMVFPIDWPEPFGLVMTEALACGTPVVARPLGAAPEVVVDGETGFLRTELDALAEAALEATTLSPMACRRSIERRFSAQAMVTGYERVYRSAVAARDHAPSMRRGFAVQGRSAHRVGTFDSGPAG